MTSFPFGQTLPPEKASFGALSRRLYCVTQEFLGQLAQAARRRRGLTWKNFWGPHWSATRRTIRGELVLKVLYCDSGWWRVRLFEEDNGELHDLCLAFTDCAALFPSAHSAKQAGEIFSSDQNWNVGMFVWVDQDDEWYFAGRQPTATH
jgi:hypothetical protein